MKTAIVMFFTIAICISSGAARADNQVVTIYFSGTKMTKDMWSGSQSVFGEPETIATLHKFQLDGEDYPGHHKGIVNGFQGLYAAVPDWTRNFNEGLKTLNTVIDSNYCNGRCITLNLVGFSRGSVSAMHFAHQIFHNPGYTLIGDRISNTNILVFDPVPGDESMPADIFNLPENTSYLGFYAQDERSDFFAAVVPNPYYLPTMPAPWVAYYQVPGSHETMVGSTMRDGHSRTTMESYVKDADLERVSRTLKIVALEIMGGSDWGHVRFLGDANHNMDWYDGSTNILTLRQTFKDQVKALEPGSYGPNKYQRMRFSSFLCWLPGWDGNCLVPSVGAMLEYWKPSKDGSTCYNTTRSYGDDYSDIERLRRCAYYKPYSRIPLSTGWSGKLGGPNMSIAHAPITDIRQKDGDHYAIWNMIFKHGSFDVDGDYIDYNEDNCPTVANVDQVNSDVIADTKQDAIKGDLCDDCTDLDGDGYGNVGFGNDCPDDNCSSIANTDQANFDGDSFGDACDSDDDNDAVLDIHDLCPETPLETVVNPLNGCSLDQLVPCDGPRSVARPWKNHGEYVSKMTKVTKAFVRKDLISSKERGYIVSSAGKSECGAR